MGLLAKVFPSWAAKSQEGQYRPGPWHLPLTGGWLPHDVGTNLNWWQCGFNPVGGYNTSSMVEACVSAYSQTVAMLPGNHWRRNDKGGRERVDTSALARILIRPNSYQTISDFVLNLTRSLYREGNGYALVLRNGRFEVDSLHLMNPSVSSAHVAADGEIFYSLGGNNVIEQRAPGQLMVPARDVFHVRLHTGRDHLRGHSPLEAAALSIASNSAIAQGQIQFYLNQSRPSTVLSTDMTLTREQVTQLREAWNEQAKGLSSGGTPILTSGLKPVSMGSTARDSQLAEILKMNDQDIALAFRVPLQILGIGGTPFASTEALMQFWLAGGLNFALNHIEKAFDKLFGLEGEPNEYFEFDVSVLLRAALRDRVESYAAGTRAGIFAPNEARAEFELARVADGDDPRMQQQDVPLSYGAELEPPAPAAEPAPAPPPLENDEAPEDESAKFNSDEIFARLSDNAELH